MRTTITRKTLFAGIAGAAVASVITAAAMSGSSASLELTSARVPAHSHHKALDIAHLPVLGNGRPIQSPGGSQLGRKPSGKQADKYTQVHSTITNHTDETLVLEAEHADQNNKWGVRPVNLAPGQSETVNVYSATTAHMWLTYESQDTHTVFQLDAETPFAGSNSTSGSSSSTSYTVAHQTASGYNPTDSFVIQAGGEFDYTGQAQQYVVPAGVTELNVSGIGGASLPSTSFKHAANGAEVTGTLDVTPGEVLTIGVGGTGSCSTNSLGGGWGMKVGDADYSGGDGAAVADDGNACSGGGATVIQDGSGKVVLVAGGGGGAGGATTSVVGYEGGRGGYNGIWTGENGNPFPGGGGKAGANSTTKGQDSAGGGASSGGGGGGGAAGGMAGSTGAGAGGGAGSSMADSSIHNASVQTAPAMTGNIAAGKVVIVAAN